MKKQIQKYFSFLFLFLFLFPLAEKQIHSFDHSNDAHCAASDKHFHSPEHSCAICDYNASDSAAAAVNDFSFIPSAFFAAYNSFAVSVNSREAFTDIPSRAPPLV